MVITQPDIYNCNVCHCCGFNVVENITLKELKLSPDVIYEKYKFREYAGTLLYKGLSNEFVQVTDYPGLHICIGCIITEYHLSKNKLGLLSTNK